MRKWNQADGALAAAALFFVVSLALRLRYCGAVWAEALLFCSEAALVGGIADWFAVTALFKKPLGFPWHTALLSRRRAQLTAACVKLVQEEFFSKKKLIAHLRRMEFFELLLRFAQRRQGRDLLAGWILQALEDSVRRADLTAMAAEVQQRLETRLQGVTPQEALCAAQRFLLADGKAEAHFDRLLDALRAWLVSSAAREELCVQMEAYAAQRTGGIVSSLLAMLAQRSNLLNFAEAAELLQAQLLVCLDEMAAPQSARRAELLRVLRDSAGALLRSEACEAAVSAWMRALFAQFPGEAACQAALRDSLRALLRDAPVRPPCRQLIVQKPLVQLVLAQIDALLEGLRQDAALRSEIDAYLYDFAGRATLQAQEMAGAAVAAILDDLDDTALSELLYKKVEPDLIWIRMNGTIVGGCIGLVLFALLHLFD